MLLARSGPLSSLELPARSSLRFVGIGSGFALWLVVAGSPGFAELHAGRSLAGAFAWIAVGVIAAMAIELLAHHQHVSGAAYRWSAVVLGAAGALAVIGWVQDTPRLGDVLISLFALAVTSLTMRCASAGTCTTSGLRPAALWAWRVGGPGSAAAASRAHDSSGRRSLPNTPAPAT